MDTRGQGRLMFCSLFSKGAISEQGKIPPRVKGRDRASGAFAQPLWDNFYQQGWSLMSGLCDLICDLICSFVSPQSEGCFVDSSEQMLPRSPILGRSSLRMGMHILKHQLLRNPYPKPKCHQLHELVGLKGCWVFPAVPSTVNIHWYIKGPASQIRA